MAIKAAVAILLALQIASGFCQTSSPTLDFLETIPELSNFTATVEFSKLYEILDGPDGPYTIFAPDNAGFEKSLTPFDITWEYFASGTEEEAEHALFHLEYMVVNGTYRYADLYAGQELPSIMPNQAVFFIQPSRYDAEVLYAVGNNTYYERGNRGRILESDLAVPGTDNIVHIINAFLFTEDEE